MEASVAVRDINHLMLHKYGTCINPATFGFVTLHDFLDYLEKCNHIKFEFGCVKSVDKEDFDIHAAGYESDKFFPDDVEKKSSTEEKDSKTESARFFSGDEDTKLLSAVAAEYYKVFPDKAQPDSHQILQYHQHGSSPATPKGEEPRCPEARHHTSKVVDQLIQRKQAVAVAPNPVISWSQRHQI